MFHCIASALKLIGLEQREFQQAFGEPQQRNHDVVEIFGSSPLLAKYLVALRPRMNIRPIPSTCSSYTYSMYVLYVKFPGGISRVL